MKLMRIQEMEEYILKHGATSLDELCEVFNVSKTRSDAILISLRKKGLSKGIRRRDISRKICARPF